MMDARLKKYLPRFRNKEARNLMALTLAMDPKVRKELRTLFRMGARDIRPDYMYVLNKEKGRHVSMDDPGAWNCSLDLPSGTVMLIILVRHKNGEWSLHGT